MSPLRTLTPQQELAAVIAHEDVLDERDRELDRRTRFTPRTFPSAQRTADTAIPSAGQDGGPSPGSAVFGGSLSAGEPVTTTEREAG